MLLTTTPWSVSELRDGRVTTSDSDPSRTKALSLIVMYLHLSRPPSLPAACCNSGGGTSLSWPNTPPPISVVSPHRIIHPPGYHLSPSLHTNVPCLSPIIFYPCSPPSDPLSILTRLLDSSRCRTLAAHPTSSTSSGYFY